MMRRGLAGTAATLVALALPPAASADVDDLLVDTTSDDVALDDCTATAADCSLAGAFERAADGDPAEDTDKIDFDPAIFDGTQVSATIELAAPLVANDALDLGLNCVLDKPCVGIDAPPTGNAISIQEGPFRMNGLAIFNAVSQGIFFGAFTDDVQVENSWFGLELDGTVSGNQVGLNVTGNDTKIGGIDESDRNVFVGNEIGIRLFGGPIDTKIRGNLFGVRPNNALAGNSIADIQLQGNFAGTGPSGTVIGGAPNETPECDGACNVIGATGGVSSDGLDLASENAGTSSATDIEIRGNHIGLRAGGDTRLATPGPSLTSARPTM